MNRMNRTSSRLNILLGLSLAALACLTAAPAPPAHAQSSAAADQVPPGPTRLLRYADISKDRVVFAYAGDLWIASREGGVARRLTSHVGDELYPKFSPDGKWIAFTGQYDGNTDVYIVPTEGGEPKRLTWHPLDDLALGFTPDGASVLYSSPAQVHTRRYVQLFTVPRDGGEPTRLPIPHAFKAAYSPDGA